jgi:hypothetical protein
MNLFQKFVQENVDQSQTSKSERILLLPRELEKAFEHYCRKRNISFNEGIIGLIEDALDLEKKPQQPEEENTRSNSKMFMYDAL